MPCASGSALRSSPSRSAAAYRPSSCRNRICARRPSPSRRRTRRRSRRPGPILTLAMPQSLPEAATKRSGLLHVAGEDAGRKALRHAVLQRQPVLERADLHHAGMGEGFVQHDAVAAPASRPAPGGHRTPRVEIGERRPPPSRRRRRPPRQRRLHRPNAPSSISGPTSVPASSGWPTVTRARRLQARDQRVIDVLVRGQTAQRRAALPPCRRRRRDRRTASSRSALGIDHHRVVAAEFQQGAAEPFGDAGPTAPHPGRTGGADQRNAPVGGERMADVAADETTGTDPSGASPKRAVGRLEQRLRRQRGQRRLLRTASRSSDRRNEGQRRVPGPDRHGEVEGRDDATGPSGCQVSIIRWPGRSWAMVRPYSWRDRPTAKSQMSIISCTSPRPSCRILPDPGSPDGQRRLVARSSSPNRRTSSPGAAARHVAPDPERRLGRDDLGLDRRRRVVGDAPSGSPSAGEGDRHPRKRGYRRTGMSNVGSLGFVLSRHAAAGARKIASAPDTGSLECRNSDLQPLGASAVSDPYTVTTNKSYFQRLSDSFGGIVGGFVLIVVCCGLLWWNGAAPSPPGLSAATDAAISLTATTPDAANDGKLVHMTGEAKATAPISDADLGIAFMDALVVSRKAEMYQWKEDLDQDRGKARRRRDDDHDLFLQARMVDVRDRLLQIQRRRQRRRRSQGRRAAGQSADDAEIGRLCRLRRDARRLQKNPRCSARLSGDATPKPVSEPAGWTPTAQGYYAGDGMPEEPKVGDMRVTYTYLASPQTVSVLARQQGPGLEPGARRTATGLSPVARRQDGGDDDRGSAIGREHDDLDPARGGHHRHLHGLLAHPRAAAPHRAMSCRSSPASSAAASRWSPSRSACRSA